MTLALNREPSSGCVKSDTMSHDQVALGLNTPQGDDDMTTWYDDEPDGDEDWPFPEILDDLLGDDKRCWIPWDEGFGDD